MRDFLFIRTIFFIIVDVTKISNVEMFVSSPWYEYAV